MKKYLILSIILILAFSSYVSAIPINNEKEPTMNPQTSDLTHTVFVEECTATWCPNCPFAAEALYSIYESGDYPFYYVALVHDMNPLAVDRLEDYVMNIFKGFAFPIVYFDGGDVNMVGRGSTVEETETMYREIIEEVGARAVKQPITLDSTVVWDGNAQITVTVDVTNDGNFFYLGRIRSYITEIESRWINDDGNPYHFGFLDFAINKPILILPGQAKTFTATWDGTQTHGNQTFGDITEDNIMVISTISHWIPHHRIGYDSEEFTQHYLARYVDQATGVTPS
jgi:thiol-disulfide isomerase/thioredoxin